MYFITTDTLSVYPSQYIFPDQAQKLPPNTPLRLHTTFYRQGLVKVSTVEATYYTVDTWFYLAVRMATAGEVADLPPMLRSQAE